MHNQRIYDDMYYRKKINEEKVKLASIYYKVTDLEEYKKMITKIQKLFAETLKA